jgi:hypothetical protein
MKPRWIMEISDLARLWSRIIIQSLFHVNYSDCPPIPDWGSDRIKLLAKFPPGDVDCRHRSLDSINVPSSVWAEQELKLGCHLRHQQIARLQFQRTISAMRRVRTGQFIVVVAEDDLQITDWMENLLSMCPIFVARTIKKHWSTCFLEP